MMVARPPAVRAAATVRPAATAPSPTAKSLPLARAGTASNFAWSGKKTATLYRVTAPADPVLVHGNRSGELECQRRAQARNSVDTSIRIHERLGFEPVAHVKEVG